MFGLLKTNKMDLKQLEDGNKLKEKKELITKTSNRVANLSLSWSSSGTRYTFTNDELGNDKKLSEIFRTATNAARSILNDEIARYEKEVNKEFENL
jgi:hypothetical protein